MKKSCKARPCGYVIVKKGKRRMKVRCYKKKVNGKTRYFRKKTRKMPGGRKKVVKVSVKPHKIRKRGGHKKRRRRR